MDRRNLIILVFGLILNFNCRKSETKDFNLLPFIDHKGLEFRLEDYKNKKLILYFGFSHCPDKCPMALSLLSNALKGVGDKNIFLIFITLDPNRDDPIRLSGYIKQLNNQQIIGITGKPANIAQLASYFGIESIRRDLNNSYLLDHSNQILLLGDNFSILKRFPSNLSMDTLQNEITSAWK